MTKSSVLGLQTGMPTISLQGLEDGTWRLSFSAGPNVEVELYTGSDIKLEWWEGPEPVETKYGYRAYPETPGPPTSEATIDAIRILGPFDKIEITTEKTNDFYMNDEKVKTGTEVVYEMPLLQRPMVKAGLGVAGVAIATGVIGKLLDWW